MSEREFISSSSSSEDAVETNETTYAPQVDTSSIDDLLSEIDSVLETNAEEFVRGFVQKGGQ